MLKNIGKTLLSPFLAMDDGKAVAVAEEQEISHTPTRVGTEDAAHPYNTYATVPRGTVDEGMLQNIMDMVNKATPEALTSFDEMLDEFKDVAADEKTRFKSAYIAFTKATKKTVSDINAAMQSRLAALDQAEAQFTKEAAEEASAISAIRAKADSFDKQITDLRNQKQKAADEANTRETALSESQATFTATADSVREQLNAEQSHLTTYLPVDLTGAPARKGVSPRGSK